MERTAWRISPHPCRRGARTCPCSAAYSSNGPISRTSGRGDHAGLCTQDPTTKPPHSLTRTSPNGRDANSLASINSVHMRSAALAHNSAAPERDSTAGSDAAHCQLTQPAIVSRSGLLRWASRPRQRSGHDALRCDQSILQTHLVQLTREITKNVPGFVFTHRRRLSTITAFAGATFHKWSSHVHLA